MLDTLEVTLGFHLSLIISLCRNTDVEGGMF